MNNIQEDNKEVKFFGEAYNALINIYEKNPNEKNLEKWKKQVVPKLKGSYAIKIKRLKLYEPIYDAWIEPSTDEHYFKMAKAVIEDAGIDHLLDNSKKDTIEIKKLKKAREKNVDFEDQLADMICGKNNKFPAKNFKESLNFFKKLGYNFEHDSENKDWLEEILEELNTKEIHNIITTGLFRKTYYENALNKSLDTKPEDFLKGAKLEFKDFIQNSLTNNEVFDLSKFLDMNINIELLFDNEANTEDKELNNLIEEAKERYLNQDSQVAIEKLWDAFERLKTHFSTDKKSSSSQLVNIISKDFDETLINEEFKQLTSIGNDYRIRHHETNKNQLTEQHRNYFFFRMLSLIDLCLTFLNIEKEMDIF